MLATHCHQSRVDHPTAVNKPAHRKPSHGDQPQFNLLWRRLSTRVQTKLKVDAPGDVYEREADRVAGQLVRVSDSELSSQSAVSQRVERPMIQRMCPNSEQEEGTMQRKPNGAAHTVSPSITAQVSRLHGGGQPLPQTTRSYFEPRFGADFSQVRLHTDSPAAESAQSLSALAYTVGTDIAFGPGQFAPESTRGKHLLAHELTHVIQQAPSKVARHGEEPGANWHISSLTSRPYIARSGCPAVHDKRDCPMGRKCGDNDRGKCDFKSIEEGCHCNVPRRENPPSKSPTTLGMIGAGLGSIFGTLGGASLGVVGGLPGVAYGSVKGADVGSDFGGAVGDTLQSGIDWLFGD